MARPSKAVVEYYPHIIEHSRSLKILLKTFGNKAYMFWYELLGLLGSTENHYFDINEEAKFEDFYTDCFITKEEAIEILNKCASLGMIDKELYQDGIIFSENFIDNIRDAYNRRKIDLMEKDAITGLLIQNKRIKRVIVDINPEIDDNNPQSKVNKSKQDEIIKKNLHQELIDFEQFYNSLNDKKIRMTAQIQEKVKNALIDEDFKLWQEVIEKSANKGHFINNRFIPLSAENMIDNYTKILEETYGLLNREETKITNGDKYYANYNRV